MEAYILLKNIRTIKSLLRTRAVEIDNLTNCRVEQQEKQVEESTARRPRLKQGRVSPRLSVAKHIPRPPYTNSKRAPAFLDEFQIQDAEGIERMRASGQLAARVRDYAGTLVKVSFLYQPNHSGNGCKVI